MIMERRAIDEYRAEFDPANTFTVPCNILHEGCANITIAIEPVGGGEPGMAYANNRWIYEVRVNGEFILDGDDLRSGGIPADAEEMARTLANLLSAYTEDTETFGMFDTTMQEFLRAEGERLGMWGSEGHKLPHRNGSAEWED